MTDIEVIVKDLYRRAALADKNATCVDAGNLLREVARACSVALNEGVESERLRKEANPDVSCGPWDSH